MVNENSFLKETDDILSKAEGILNEEVPGLRISVDEFRRTTIQEVEERLQLFEERHCKDNEHMTELLTINKMLLNLIKFDALK